MCALQTRQALLSKIVECEVDNYTLSLVARIAQSVEQRIENPRVPGSIPGSGTII